MQIQQIFQQCTWNTFWIVFCFWNMFFFEVICCQTLAVKIESLLLLQFSGKNKFLFMMRTSALYWPMYPFCKINWSRVAGRLSDYYGAEIHHTRKVIVCGSFNFSTLWLLLLLFCFCLLSLIRPTINKLFRRAKQLLLTARARVHYNPLSDCYYRICACVRACVCLHKHPCGHLNGIWEILAYLL